MARSEVTEAFAREIVGDPVQVEILQGRRHEPFQDVGREEVFALVAHWLEERVDLFRAMSR